MTVERRITELFLKSVGSGLGFYNAATKSFQKGLESEPLYQANLEIVQAALKSGWKASELEDHIVARYKAGERQALLSDILPNKAPAKRIDEEENLLETGPDYQHTALYLRSAPTFAVVGESMVPMQRGSVKPKDEFTLRDLCNYYFETMRVPNTPRRWANALGSFRWLLGEARVDEVLTAVDLACAVNDETPVLRLSDYLDEARADVAAREARLQRVA